MPVKAASAEVGGIYRQTRNPSPGVFYTPSRQKTETHQKRLGKKQRTGREEYLYARFCEGWVAFYRVTRRVDELGRRQTHKILCAVPPDYTLRQCQTKPGYKPHPTSQRSN